MVGERSFRRYRQSGSERETESKRARSLPDRRVFSVQAERQALRAAPRFQELVELGGDGRVAPGTKSLFELGSAGVDHHRLAYHHGIAAEAMSFAFDGREQLGHVRLQHLPAVGV